MPNLFGRKEKLILGVVHLLPLAGSPRYGGDPDEILAGAVADAARIIEGGAHGFVVENFGDLPFQKGAAGSAVVAQMTRILTELRARAGNAAILGVNVLRNDAEAALAIAAATGCDFIRVNVHTGTMFTDQGMLEGNAAATLRMRSLLVADVAILADVAVKHALPPAGFDFEQAAKDCAYRGLADGIIITGRATGEAAAIDHLERARAALPEHPILVGSGVDPSNIVRTLAIADGVIVGTALKQGGIVTAPVDAARVRALVAAATTQAPSRRGKKRST